MLFFNETQNTYGISTNRPTSRVKLNVQ